VRLPPPLLQIQTKPKLAGIGLMIAKALALNGASKVYIAGRRLAVLERAAATIGTGNIAPIVVDVTSQSSLEAAVARVKTETGYLNLLVCNSGIGGPQVAKPAPEESVLSWRAKNLANGFDDYVDTFRVNTAATWYTVMQFLELLEEGNKKGNVGQTSQILVTSSIAGFNRTAPGGFAYGQSKAGVTHLVKQLATLLPQWDLRINAIAPGCTFVSSKDYRYRGRSCTDVWTQCSLVK
jgi:NAD(P)-dependent dehydrogenase (short-subunit alcohol dehydrogenase family)